MAKYVAHNIFMTLLSEVSLATDNNLNTLNPFRQRLTHGEEPWTGKAAVNSLQDELLGSEVIILIIDSH